jgi:hypothetical protein
LSPQPVMVAASMNSDSRAILECIRDVYVTINLPNKIYLIIVIGRIAQPSGEATVTMSLFRRQV